MAKKEIPTSLKEKGFNSYSQAIREITGWSKKEFETQKRVMRYRVSNFNKVTGSNLSAIEELYYKVRYEDRARYYASKGKEVYDPSLIQKTLKDIKTTPVKNTISKNQSRVAKNYVLDKFEGLGKTYKYASDIIDKLKKDELTPRQANEKLKQYAEEMKVLKNKNPTSWLDAQDESYLSSL